MQIMRDPRRQNGWDVDGDAIEFLATHAEHSGMAMPMKSLVVVNNSQRSKAAAFYSVKNSDSIWLRTNTP